MFGDGKQEGRRGMCSDRNSETYGSATESSKVVGLNPAGVETDRLEQLPPLHSLHARKSSFTTYRWIWHPSRAFPSLNPLHQLPSVTGV